MPIITRQNMLFAAAVSSQIFSGFTASAVGKVILDIARL